MSDDSIKKLRDALKDEIKPIKEIVEIIEHKIGVMEMSQLASSESIRRMRDQQSVMNDKLDEQAKELGGLAATQETHTRVLVELENETIPLVKDMHALLKDQS